MSPAGAGHATVSYVPRLVQARMASGAITDQAVWETQRAAVLLGDLEGSTAIAQHFAAAGASGLEQFTWSMNAYFSDFVAIVTAAGGDVLYIAGDAFLCYWPVSDSVPLSLATAWAVHAGLTVQDQLHDREAGLGRHFRLRIGVGAGELVTAFLGGYRDRWQLVTLGDALRQAILSEKDAEPGTVVAPEAVVTALGEQASADPLPGRLHRLVKVAPTSAPVPLAPVEHSSSLERLLRPYIPDAVRAQVHLPDPNWLAESRAVTALITDLASLGVAGQLSSGQTDGAVRTFQEVLGRFEGSVKVDVDDKGIVLLGVFGLPPMVHEDGAARAVLAALELERRLDQLSIRHSCGIATGRVICGSFGSHLRREYLLRGEVINRAARLMDSIEQGIACDAATVQAARGPFRFARSGDTRARTDERPETAFRPEPHASEPPAAAVFGRESERAALSRMLSGATATERPTPSIYIEADAGLGKSNLARSAIHTANRVGLHVLEGHGDSFEQRTPYFPWRALFSTVLPPRDSGTDGFAATLARQVRAAGIDPRLSPLASVVAPVLLPDNPLTADMHGEVREFNTRTVLLTLLTRYLALRPSLIIMDDLHFMDPSSLALLHAVMRQRPAGALLMTSRPDGDESVTALREQADQVLTLNPLESAEIGALLRAQLGVTEVPDEFVMRVTRRSEGNPFYAEEIARAMVANRHIEVTDDRVTVGDADLEELPISVESAILSAFDRLPAEQQLSLKVASVLGHRFSAEIVCAIWPLGETRSVVLSALEQLADQGLTLREASGDESAFRFRHVITRDVIYALMPQSQRSGLHEGVVRWYEQRSGAELPFHYPLLAFHADRAGNLELSCRYLGRSGHAANRAGAFSEAAACFSRCLEGAGRRASDDRGREVFFAPAALRATWLHGLGVAQYFSGAHVDSRRSLERAVSVLDRPLPGPFGLAGALLINLLPQLLHRRRTPPRRLNAGHRPELGRAVDCYKILGQIYYLAGEPAPRLLYATLRGLNVGERVGPSAPLAAMLQNVAVISSLMGFKKAGRQYADRARSMAIETGEYAAAGYVWHIRAIQLAQDGDWTGALESSGRAMELLQQLDDRSLMAEAFVVRSTVLLASGDFANAPTAWREARRLAVDRGNTQIECWTWLDEVDTCIGAGDTIGARAALDRALAIETADADGSSTVDKQRALMMTCWREGHLGAALEAADTVIALVTRQPPSGYHWVDYFASATEFCVALVEIGEQPAAALPPRRELVSRARRTTRKLRSLSRTFWNVKARALTLSARLAAANGKPADAEKQLESALNQATGLNMPYEAALAELALARLQPRRAEGLLASASRTFASLGATACLASVADARADVTPATR
ncbi:MAG: AAA family ATPase [Pseudomonadota bacterium]